MAEQWRAMSRAEQDEWAERLEQQRKDYSDAVRAYATATPPVVFGKKPPFSPSTGIKYGNSHQRSIVYTQVAETLVKRHACRTCQMVSGRKSRRRTKKQSSRRSSKKLRKRWQSAGRRCAPRIQQQKPLIRNQRRKPLPKKGELHSRHRFSAWLVGSAAKWARLATAPPRCQAHARDVQKSLRQGARGKRMNTKGESTTGTEVSFSNNSHARACTSACSTELLLQCTLSSVRRDVGWALTSAAVC